MNTSIIERNILDKNIYHDITGREIKHGDIVTSTFDNVFLGIAEYVNFIQDSKFESGIAFHIYKKIPKTRKQFFELVHEKDTVELTNTTISCYSKDFICDFYSGNYYENSNHSMLELVILNELNIKERYSKEEYQLFLDVQKQILNTKNKVYKNTPIKYINYNGHKIDVNDLIKIMSTDIDSLLK